MKNPTTRVFSASLLLALSVAAPAAEKDVDFRVDVFVGQQDGYHSYRIPAMVATAKGAVLLFCEGRKNSRRDSGDIDLLMKRSEDGFFTGRMDHFRIYRKARDDFAALGPAPAPLTQIPEVSGTDKEPSEAANIHALQQKFIYHTTADWEGRTPGEVDGTAPPKFMKWFQDVRGY
ncbi:MAG: sialidase family protein [Verrucomicrobia bacterium]|nr:sialidase family protein [Verrucomicrobiota bacterium]